MSPDAPDKDLNPVLGPVLDCFATRIPAHRPREHKPELFTVCLFLADFAARMQLIAPAARKGVGEWGTVQKCQEVKLRGRRR